MTSYLMPRHFFHYRLPHKAPDGQQLLYIPYWRFRGMMFSCVARDIQQQFVDLSQLALDDTPLFPGSLGLRAQAMKLKFVTPDTEGYFVHSSMSFKKAMQCFENRFNETKAGKPIFREYIGETASLIYAPYYVSNKLYDAVLNQPHAGLSSHDFNPDELPGGSPGGGDIRFQAILCPACGWDMTGERDSQVLCCHNCQSVWQPTARQFVKLKFGHLPAATNEPVKFFPFWRIRATVSGLQLKTAADVIQLANLPKVARPEDHATDFHFWSLAFKVRPQVFIRLASSLTLSQPKAAPLIAEIPRYATHPVNLPIMEAVESLKISLAGFMKPRRHLFPRLPDISIQPLSFKLIFMPFIEGHHDYIHPGLNLAINKNMLKLSGNL